MKKLNRLTFIPAPRKDADYVMWPRSEYQRRQDAEIREVSGGDFFVAELIRQGIMTIDECREQRNDYRAV